jgi:hypothetical protein
MWQGQECSTVVLYDYSIWFTGFCTFCRVLPLPSVTTYWKTKWLVNRKVRVLCILLYSTRVFLRYKSYTSSHPEAPLWSVTGPLYLFYLFSTNTGGWTIVCHLRYNLFSACLLCWMISYWIWEICLFFVCKCVHVNALTSQLFVSLWIISCTLWQQMPYSHCRCHMFIC